VIEQTATVVRREGDLAWVDTRPASACGGCAAAEGCGTGVWVRWFGARRGLLPARDGLGTAPGDRVVIGVPERAFLGGSLAVYLLPLGALLAGAWLAGVLVGTGDGPVLTGALAGLALGLLLVRRLGGRWLAGTRPRVLRRLDDGV